jgi:hypothetical protein
MSIRQTLQAASNGTVWSRREGGTTYFLRKVNNTYEVWTSLASGAKSTVTVDQAVTYYSQHNLINANTAAPSPAARPAAPTRPTPQPPTPAPAAPRRPAPVSTPAPTPPAPTPRPATAPSVVTETATTRTGPTTTDPNNPLPLRDEGAEGGNVGDVTGGDIIVTGERIRPDAFKSRADWRVRLALSDDPSVNYLYKAPNPGILRPLNATNGVIFPYTPTISVNYSANYNATDLIHSNYKVYQYSNSSVESISIQGEFTAQDEYEANYLLAVIHFFRSATKMFYGQDQNPRRGTPPPLCYIYGMGSYQFAGQPLAMTQFSYNLPQNVDYIKTTVGTSEAPTAAATAEPNRTDGTGVTKGGVLPAPQYTPISEPNSVSWVPTRIQINVSCAPMMSRNQVSNEFSFEKYATGSLLNGVGKSTGGFW